MDLMLKRRALAVQALLLIALMSACSSAGKKSAPSEASAPQGPRLSSKELKSLGLHFSLLQKRLANGLKILVIEDSTVPLVAYQTWVNVGSVDETFGLTGM